MSVTFHFPSQQSIVAYLEKHPFTNDPYLKEKKIIDTVAKFFANTNKDDRGVELGVLLALYRLNAQIGLTQDMKEVMNINLIDALKDCGSDKQFLG